MSEELSPEQTISVVEPNLSAALGYMLPQHLGEEPMIVSRTPENEHFFVHNGENDRYELAYIGSATIVGIIKGRLEVEKLLEDETDVPTLMRHWAFFDTSGNFYDQVLIRDLKLRKVNNEGAEKHTAVFDILRGRSYERMEIAVDDIYTLCLAKPEHPAPES